MTEYLSLKKSNCKNCYKCIRHCPVKSIRFTDDRAYIVEDECILCGECYVVCPQDAKEIRNDLPSAKRLVAENSFVAASIAPSFVANYGISVEALADALKKLGFALTEETALGATQVKRRYEEMTREEGRKIIISSCCHSVNLLIRKYYPEAISCLADVTSPMLAHAKDIKSRNPGAKVIFIGPCISKKSEADEYQGIVDCALTFEELSAWLDEAGIELKHDEKIAADAKTKARLFPTSGGILRTMDCDTPGWSYLTIDGTENCREALDDIVAGKLDKCFIEMSACRGSCVNGPIMEKKRHTPVSGTVAVYNYAGREDFDVNQPSAADMKKAHTRYEIRRNYPGEAKIREILQQMGKTSPADELNCGTCGYPTCRDKAIAVYQGKANISMCLPFLKEKAESFSDTIINNTPNGIIVLNESLEVEQVNRAALELLKIRAAADVLGEPVVRILDPKIFLDVLTTGKPVRGERTFLAEYNKYVEQTITYDKSYQVIICILRDVTAEEDERLKKEELSRHTVEITDKVIEKQMRVVQEIASLLGETTAETKIALTRLKESLNDE
ncbi:MAG: 4Fe-4S binding protein [Clostridia bacterium]|nr:4Fe-4S binding protein [Clostridia bacterium]